MRVYKHTKEYIDAWRNRNREYTMYSGAKHRAKKKGLEFTISIEDIIIPETCPILGIKLKKNIGSGFHNDSPSLDRIDNNKGYSPDNIRVISNRANLLKCDATLEELEAVVSDARSIRSGMQCSAQSDGSLGHCGAGGWDLS